MAAYTFSDAELDYIAAAILAPLMGYPTTTEAN